MKILLDNNNASIANVVHACCERTNAELAAYSADISDYDLIIKDCDENSDISEFDKKKTLFLVPRNLVDKFSSYNYLKKPFLPIELINFLANFGVEDKNLQTTQENYEITEAMHGKIAQDIKTISKIVKEIDEIPEKQDEQIQTGGVSMPSANIDNVIDDFYISDDDKPLDELLKEINELKEKGIIGAQAQNDAAQANSQSTQNEPTNTISLDENFELDDDIPLDEFIKNMQNNGDANLATDNENSVGEISAIGNENPATGDEKILIDENFELDDDIPLDEFIKNMQNQDDGNSQNDEFNQILESIDENSIANGDNGEILEEKNDISQDTQKDNEEEKNTNENKDETPKDDDLTPIALVFDADEGTKDENKTDSAKVDEVETKDDIEQIPLVLDMQDEKQDELKVESIELENLEDDDLPILSELGEKSDDDLLPLELVGDDDLLPLEFANDDEVQKNESNLGDENLPILSELDEIGEDSENELLPLLDEKIEISNTQNETISEDSNAEKIEISEIQTAVTENAKTDETSENSNNENEKATEIKADKPDFSDLKLVAVGKFDDDDLVKKVDLEQNLDRDLPQIQEPQELENSQENIVNLQENIENLQDNVENSQKDVKNLDDEKVEKIDENLQTSENLSANLAQNEELKIEEKSPEFEDKSEANLDNNGDEMDIYELKEKLESTFKSAFEQSVAADERLARALENLKLDLSISFKDR